MHLDRLRCRRSEQKDVEMKSGKPFRTFVETLCEGDVIWVDFDGPEEVTIHHPACEPGCQGPPRLGFWGTYGSPDSKCLKSDFLTIYDFGEAYYKSRYLVEALVDGALQLRGLTLSCPTIVVENGTVLVANAATEAEETRFMMKLEELDDLSFRMEYKVIKLPRRAGRRRG